LKAKADRRSVLSVRNLPLPAWFCRCARNNVKGSAMDDQQGGMNMGFGRFAATIATSTVVMSGLMYLNTMR